MQELAGRTALVTGALGDIGSAISVALLEAGATVFGLGRTPPANVKEKVEHLERAGTFHYMQVDVTDHPTLGAAVADLPHLDIVVGNAGVVEPARFVDVTETSLARQVATNFTSNYVLGQVAARRFIREATPGRIVYVGSWVGERPWPEISAYSATKAALQMLTRSMALELAPAGIRVNLVAPGIVNAGMAREEADRNPEYAARAAKAVPLGYLQDPKDVASMVVFLVGDGAASVTGATLLVDGGSTLGSI